MLLVNIIKGFENKENISTDQPQIMKNLLLEDNKKRENTDFLLNTIFLQN